MAAGAAAQPERHGGVTGAQVALGLAEVADVVAGVDFDAVVAGTAHFRDLRNQPQPLLGRRHQVAIFGHVARGDGELQLPGAHADVDEKLAQLGKLAGVEAVNRRVDAHRQAGGQGVLHRLDHAPERTLGAEAVMLLFQPVEAESDTTQTGLRGLLGMAGGPCPTVGDQADLGNVLGQAPAHLVPVRVERGLAPGERGALASQGAQLVGHAQAFFQGQLVGAARTCRRATVSAAQVAPQGQLPRAGARGDAGPPQNFQHRWLLAVATACGLLGCLGWRNRR